MEKSIALLLFILCAFQVYGKNKSDLSGTHAYNINIYVGIQDKYIEEEDFSLEISDFEKERDNFVQFLFQFL